MGDYLALQYGEKDMSLWVDPAYSLQPWPVIIRQANIEYQLRNIKGKNWTGSVVNYVECHSWGQCSSP